MNRFSKLHPLLHLLFYSFSLIFVLIASNPFFSFASLIGAFLYNGVIHKSRIFKNLRLILLIIIFVSLFNMLFAHYGVHILFKIKYTPFTLEALFYGFNQGMVLSSVLLWFSALSYNFDGDRVLYLFRFAPKLSLMFSIILGFIPRFNKKLSEIREAQLALKGGEAAKGLKGRFEDALSNLSALITYSLESSIITADSMNARGYNPKKISTKRYSISHQDIVLTVLVIALFSFVLFSKLTGQITFVFEPEIYSKTFSLWAFICFIIMELIPFFVEMWEEMLWKLSNAVA